MKFSLGEGGGCVFFLVFFKESLGVIGGVLGEISLEDITLIVCLSLGRVIYFLKIS